MIIYIFDYSKIPCNSCCQGDQFGVRALFCSQIKGDYLNSFLSFANGAIWPKLILMDIA